MGAPKCEVGVYRRLEIAALLGRLDGLHCRLYRGVEISRAEGDLSLSLEHVRQVPIVLEAFQRGP